VADYLSGSAHLAQTVPPTVNSRAAAAGGRGQPSTNPELPNQEARDVSDHRPDRGFVNGLPVAMVSVVSHCSRDLDLKEHRAAVEASVYRHLVHRLQVSGRLRPALSQRSAEHLLDYRTGNGRCSVVVTVGAAARTPWPDSTLS
jgi:hypothetical protein